ncbi:hypothetical protein CISG_06061 [Coccidioides immitis RMSCC 3703]|uniref:Uncharacterized protein n=1 Tax=Coccidioides immitis RMSCC 3703 TaxID=454286 RepID=A0A0J8TTT8_COCIT|nr:hypothetical protein CISG_06061 [Coccidioides immitis RMSCC 3703]
MARPQRYFDRRVLNKFPLPQQFGWNLPAPWMRWSTASRVYVPRSIVSAGLIVKYTGSYRDDVIYLSSDLRCLQRQQLGIDEDENFEPWSRHPITKMPSCKDCHLKLTVETRD